MANVIFFTYVNRINLNETAKNMLDVKFGASSGFLALAYASCLLMTELAGPCSSQPKPPAGNLERRFSFFCVNVKMNCS